VITSITTTLATQHKGVDPSLSFVNYLICGYLS
jgi:hypothetical protein